MTGGIEGALITVGARNALLTRGRSGISVAVAWARIALAVAVSRDSVERAFGANGRAGGRDGARGTIRTFVVDKFGSLHFNVFDRRSIGTLRDAPILSLKEKEKRKRKKKRKEI